MRELGYNVYKNDLYVTFIRSRSAIAAREFVKGYPIGTHIGQWRRTLTIRPENIRKTCFEREYSTTVGIYLRFVPAFRDIE